MPGGKSAKDPHGRGSEERSVTMYVGGISADATESDVRELFKKHGQVSDVEIHSRPSRENREAEIYAFVKLSPKPNLTAKDIQKELNGKQLKGPGKIRVADVSEIKNAEPDAAFVPYSIGDNKQEYIDFITKLRNELTKHNGVDVDIFDDGKSDAHRVLAEQPSSENPAQWIRIKLTANMGGKSCTTTLAVRKDNLYVKGFMNNHVTKEEEAKGKSKSKKKEPKWYELPGITEDDPKLPEKYRATQLPTSWGVKYKDMIKLNDRHQVKRTLASTMLGKAFAERAVRRLSCYHPDDVENKDENPTRLGLAGLIVMICEAARMNPFLDTIAGGWNGGTGLTERLFGVIWEWGNMSAALLYWKRSHYKKWPLKCKYTLGDALASICLVNNSNSETLKGSGGQSRVEILSVVVSADDHNISKITVTDSNRKHTIYEQKNNQEDNPKEHCLELIVLEPKKRISAYESFNIQFETSKGRSRSSTTRTWDCFKQEVERETIDLVKRTVRLDSGCKLEVTYLVMSNISTEAKVEVKLMRRKDNNDFGKIEDVGLLHNEDNLKPKREMKEYSGVAEYTVRGTVTAYIDGLEQHPIVLFKSAPEGQNVRASDNFLLPLARSDVLVPRDVKLHIDTTGLCITEACGTHQQPTVNCRKPHCLSSFDIGSTIPKYTDFTCVSSVKKRVQVRVSITWDAEEDKPVETKPPSAVLIIGDKQKFTESIVMVRKALADQEFLVPKEKMANIEAIDQPPNGTWLVTRPQPSIYGQLQYIHIELRVMAGDQKWSSTTLAVLDGSCYVVGFMNQSQVWYDLGRYMAKALPPEYNSVLLGWGLTYRDMLGVSDKDKVVDELNKEGLGKKIFAEKAVRTLSSYPDVDEYDQDLMMNPRVALAGLIVMVCESARFSPVLKYFQDNWDSNTETEGFSDKQMIYLWSWGRISRALLRWESSRYTEWSLDDTNSMLKDIITTEVDALRAVHLVFEIRRPKIQERTLPMESDAQERTLPCPPPPTKDPQVHTTPSTPLTTSTVQPKEPEHTPINHSKVERTVNEQAKLFKSPIESERIPSLLENYEPGESMLPLGQLSEEPLEIRRFHDWYIQATKAELRSFIVRVPKEAFNLTEDSEIVVDFHDMHRLLWHKDLDIAQVTLFALMRYDICKEMHKNLVYLCPTKINQRCITGFDLPDEADELKGLNKEERKRYREAICNSLKDEVATYVYRCMKSVKEHGCLLAPYCFGPSSSGHWITFLIYPQHGSAVIFDSLDYPRESYKDFETVLNSAYKTYIKDPESVDLRSEDNKAKFGHNIAVRCDFPCAKQPHGSLLCGFYTCEYLKEFEKYNISYNFLTNSQTSWEEKQIDENCITRTVADICGFIMEKCVHKNAEYFSHKSDLALNEKYEKIRNWGLDNREN